MKNPHDVLRKKELDVKRVRMEVAALHSVVSLLVEASDCAEYGLAVPPKVQEIGTGSNKPLPAVAEMPLGLPRYVAKPLTGYDPTSDNLRNRAVIRLRRIKEELSGIMPKLTLKRTA